MSKIPLLSKFSYILDNIIELETVWEEKKMLHGNFISDGSLFISFFFFKLISLTVQQSDGNIN